MTRKHRVWRTSLTTDGYRMAVVIAKVGSLTIHLHPALFQRLARIFNNDLPMEDHAPHTQ